MQQLASKNRPSGVMNLIAIIGGAAFMLLIALLVWMSNVRLPLSLAIGLCCGTAVGYSILHWLYNHASDKVLGWIIHHADDPLELLVDGGKDGVTFDPNAWEHPGRTVQTTETLAHTEGTGWTTTVIPNENNPNMTPVTIREYEDPISRLERLTMEFWANLPSLQTLLTQMLETKETFVFGIKSEVLGKEFAAQLQQFMFDEMPWIQERLRHVYANYNGMNTQRLFVWSMVQPIVDLGQKLLAIQREASLYFSDLTAEDASKILADVRTVIQEAGSELNFDQVEQLYTGATERTIFEHLQERAVEKQALRTTEATLFEQRWAYYDKAFSSEALSPFTLDKVENKAVWHPLIGLQLLQRLEFWNFVSLTKYTATELAWKFIHSIDATNGTESFFEAFKETVRFYKRITFDALSGRNGSALMQSSLLSMKHEENIDSVGNLHFVSYNGSKYQYDSRHLVNQMRGGHDGDVAAELLYIQYKNASLQNDRYLLLVIDKSVHEVRCYIGDKVEQLSMKVQLLSN